MNSPVFIVGAPRSGTTLVSQLLSTYSELFVYNETVFYDYLSASLSEDEEGVTFRRKVYEFLSQKLRFASVKEVDSGFGCVLTESDVASISKEFGEWFESNGQACDHVDIFNCFLSITARHQGKQRWGEKTPGHVYYLSNILGDFPDAQFVHVVRDPRNFLRSYKYAWAVKGARNPDCAKRLYHPLATSAHWRQSVRSFAHFSEGKGAGRCLEVRFEDVVNDVERSAKTIFQFIGADQVAPVQLPKGSNTSFRKSKKSLDTWETEVCGFLCRKEIERYGYEKVDFNWSMALSLLRAVVTLPVYCLRVYPVLKARYGGSLFKYFANRLIK
ncbi:sulfotransferase [Desulfomicrobium sp. ZS1]|uniref:sulfotransferase family protein n=1 Tax=Desulfomicrobium sp. ZS1 TaxID=2952228 RepID=UPI0020B201BC|nr:sulfotransferase [Desulfomicrobium sp. ZS1]UTF51943.1 sulfotransferase [Desulfomicrobium sp. ZS1]